MAKTSAPKRAISTFLDISTGHVAKRDMELLEGSGCPLTVYGYEHGCWVHVRAEVTDKELKGHGFSGSFRKIFAEAKAAGCRFIDFDCDGEKYEDLKHFDW